MLAYTYLQHNKFALLKKEKPVDVYKRQASVDESAITGESAPVIRESGGDRSAVTGGTTVLSDWIVVEVTSEAGESFLDKMIAMVEGAARKKTPNEMCIRDRINRISVICFQPA